MTPESRREMEDLYTAVRHLPEAERSARLDRLSCAEQRAAIEEMLARDDGEPSAHTKANTIPATWLGPFRLDIQLGAGGMGEVFRAVDTRLGRTVAIKTL